MDSLTQVALGSAVGYAVLGNKVGRKALVWGAILGTLPDLDVFLPYSGAVEAFTYHRSFSHSFFVHLLISPLIVWLIIKLHKNTQQYKKQWFYLVFLTLSTHAILDSFTVYGTQLLWPLTEYPFAVSNLFIIDPLYTVPLLIGLIIALLPRIKPTTAKRANYLGLWISSIYVCWSLAAKVFIDHKIEAVLRINQIQVDAYVSTPAPFNTLLWRAVVVSNNQYYEIYASIFDSPSEVSVSAYSRSPELLDSIENDWAVNRLQWFTKGVYSVRQNGNAVILSDLRMGIECSYVFNFNVGQVTAKGIVAGSYEKSSKRPDFSGASTIWARIWDSSISLAPVPKDCNINKM